MSWFHRDCCHISRLVLVRQLFALCAVFCRFNNGEAEGVPVDSVKERKRKLQESLANVTAQIEQQRVKCVGVWCVFVCSRFLPP